MRFTISPRRLWSYKGLLRRLRIYRRLLRRLKRERDLAVFQGRVFESRWVHARDRIQQLEAALATEQSWSERDPLTRLLNLRGFERRFQQVCSVLSRAEQTEVRSCLLFFDINNMKQANDTLGHDATDILLKHFAAILAQTFGRPQDIVSRPGGDEFLVLLPNTLPVEGMRLVTIVQHGVRELVAANIAPAFFGVSCGIAELYLPNNKEVLAQARQLADRAMYKGKHDGTGICFAEAS